MLKENLYSSKKGRIQSISTPKLPLSILPCLLSVFAFPLPKDVSKFAPGWASCQNPFPNYCLTTTIEKWMGPYHFERKCLKDSLHFRLCSGSSSNSWAILVSSKYCTKSIIERGGCPGGGKGNLERATSINEIPKDQRSERILYG